MVFIDEQRLHLGAEAEVWRGSWMGQSAIRKQRRNRTWRHPDLDDRLGRRRMIAEARLLVRLYRSGLNVPLLLDCDMFDQQLVMSYVQGKPLIEILNDTSIPDDEVMEILKNTGQSIRMLHRQAVVHGDLSTNNIIITSENEAVLIDFGLARIEYETELFGIDLHVLFEILGASHPHRKDAIEAVLEGYAACEEIYGPAENTPGGQPVGMQAVLERFNLIRTRVRYHG
ncbi:MAG: Kae1-associated serine/threonine protein kinase [Euryarchaeota archaeon]|jgi:TP53 regulating kinase-like protein|nr:Kae1-associated serine/threonine protein kinase [Euryarchaeota archaeon]